MWLHCCGKAAVGQRAQPVKRCEPCGPRRSGRGAGSTRVQGGGGRPDQPGIDRKPLAGGGVIDPGLEVIGHAQVDPRHPALVADEGRPRPRPRPTGRSASRRPRHRSSPAGSVGVVTTNSGSRPRRRTSTEAGASSQVISWAAAASASSRDETDRRVQRCDEPLGQGPCVLAAGLGGGLELVVDLVYVGLAGPCVPLWHHFGTNTTLQSAISGTRWHSMGGRKEVGRPLALRPGAPR